MKILAVEKETDGVEWGKLTDLLKDEARHVYDLYLSDALREIYFTENKNAVLMLEAEDKQAASRLLDTLPLVKAGKIRFELMELSPYTGYERIMNK
ncbi:MAG: superoxide dismutase [Bacteroidota bacterium]